MDKAGNRAKLASPVSNYKFIEDIINGMYDLVRVIDRDDNIIFMNRAMCEGLNGARTGEKCYKLIGRDVPCENCISRKAVFDGNPHEKEEIINGRIYSVMSSPLKNENGDTVAAVEVLRDITQVNALQQKIVEQNRKLQDDLNMARKLQCSLLPKGLPEDKLNFSFIYKPCETLGGDFLDIFKIDDRHVGIYIADVSGHGVSASMLTVFLRSSIDKQTLSPSKALAGLYRQFNNNSFDQDLYITVFYAILDLQDLSLTYSNAGHNVSPIIFNTGRFEFMRVPGIPISNWLQNPDYREKATRLNRGDRIFFYTDGIIELKNNRNDQFGEERLLELLLHDNSEPAGTLNRIVDTACSFAGIGNFSEIPDDITVALLEVK